MHENGTKVINIEKLIRGFHIIKETTMTGN